MAAIADGIGIPKGAIATLQAGADIVLISHRQAQQTAAIDAVIAAVESGEIAMERIDAALARVAELKRNRAVRDWRARLSRRRR